MPEHPLYVASDEIHFQVDVRIRCESAEARDPDRMGNQIHLGEPPADSVDGKAHAVHANRSFARDIAYQRARYANSKPDRIADTIECDHLPHPIHVTRDEVSTERIPKTQRTLEVHRSASVEPIRACECFVRQVELQHLATLRDDRKACALYADRIADPNSPQRQASRMDTDARGFGSAFHALDRSDRFDETGKHRATQVGREL